MTKATPTCVSEITTPSQTAHDGDHGDFDYDVDHDVDHEVDYVDAFLFDYTTMMAPVTSTTTTMLTPVITTTQTLTANYQTPSARGHLIHGDYHMGSDGLDCVDRATVVRPPAHHHRVRQRSSRHGVTTSDDEVVDDGAELDVLLSFARAPTFPRCGSRWARRRHFGEPLNDDLDCRRFSTNSSTTWACSTVDGVCRRPAGRPRVTSSISSEQGNVVFVNDDFAFSHSFLWNCLPTR